MQSQEIHGNETSSNCSSSNGPWQVMDRFATAASTQDYTPRLASPAQQEHGRLGEHCSVLLQGNMEKINVLMVSIFLPINLQDT